MPKVPIERCREEVIQVINAYSREYGINNWETVGMLEIVKQDIMLCSLEEIDDNSTRNNHD